ncbi:hypothetical protein [Aliikangiella coralliicola]|uniref:Uncharacterized protein n=1 Tax=Aliikangiella coralliicola TaxID=2592383 RepID=A0A545UDZ5_9GAMM|nr:hypothetical protein [Aliikangiella coralliicola]TQV87692.1 hypothetical protein FLL46_09915 [Aliikangiella coralliicola]
MSKSGITNYVDVRCPYCLVKRKVSQKSKAKVKCVKCLKRFSPKFALSIDDDKLANIPMQDNSISGFTLLLFAIILLLVNLYVFRLGEDTDGESFSIGYLIFTIICVVLSRIDMRGFKHFAFSLVASTGVMRLVMGMSAGMSDFGFLLFIMIIGGSLTLANSLSDVFSDKGGSSGGGCSGGCGGGCGGCG